MANGKTGLMGEAGPEAIMPLKRGPGGELGVNAVQPVVNINNNAPVAVNATSNGDGSVDITIVERAVESAIRRGGNGITSALESVYGNNRGSGAFGY
jgi:phage-related minor tail protein